MHRKFTRYLALFALCCNLNSELALAQKSAAEIENSYNFNDLSVKYEIIVKELQNLLATTEVLNHKINIIEEKINNYSKLDNSTQLQSSGNNVPEISESASNTKATDILSKELDAFDIGIQEDLTNKDFPPETIKKPIESQINKEKRTYELAIAAYKENNLQNSEKLFQEFIEKYPTNALQGNALYWLGEIYFKQNKLDKSAINFLKSYKNFPTGVKAPDSLLKLALTLGQLKKNSEACKILKKLESEFPNRPISSIKRAKDAKINFGCK